MTLPLGLPLAWTLARRTTCKAACFGAGSALNVSLRRSSL
jgi:hypothetical protein